MPARFVNPMFSRPFLKERDGDMPESPLKTSFQFHERGNSTHSAIAHNASLAGTVCAEVKAFMLRLRSMGSLAGGIYQHAAPAALSSIGCSQTVFEQAVRYNYDFLDCFRLTLFPYSL